VLLLAGIAVLVTDVLVGGVGILSVFGAAALLVGGLVLFRAPGGELMRFSYEMMVGAVLALAVFFILAAWLVVRSLRKRATSGKEGLVGAAGDVVQALLPEGMIRCHGEFWRARTESGENLSVGSRVEVVRAEGLTLVVRTVSKEEKKEEDRS
jgi:membrane-bound serine protease (ClpP class)